MTRTALTIAALLMGAPLACAQFHGDFFFNDPTPMVASGETVTLQVQVFSGNDALGAAGLRLDFDPTEFELLEVRTPSNSSLTRVSCPGPRGGTHALLNRDSLTAPFGPVALLEVTGRPLVAAGSSVSLSIQPLRALNTQGLTIGGTPTGLSAVITVVASSTLIAPARPDSITPTLLPWTQRPFPQALIGRPGMRLQVPHYDPRTGIWSRQNLILGAPTESQPGPPDQPR